MNRTRAERIQSGEPVATLPYVLGHVARIPKWMAQPGGKVPWTIAHREPSQFIWGLF